MIIWITGLSGSGKTTIAKGLINRLKARIKNLVNVDGDIIRDLFGNDLGFDINSRIKQIKRIQKLCMFLQKQNLIVIVSALYSNNDLLIWNRKNFKNYYEIYLEASLDLLKTRDVKGLYAKFSKGLEKNIVGIDIPWNTPKLYDLKINMDIWEEPDITVKKIIKKSGILVRSKLDS